MARFSKILFDGTDMSKIPPRPERSHKGTFGKVLCVCGSVGMAGASYFIALAAYRTGAGLVEIFAPEVTYSALSSKKATDQYYIAFENAEGKKCVLFFEATSKILEICKMYNPNTVVIKVRY